MEDTFQSIFTSHFLSPEYFWTVWVVMDIPSSDGERDTRPVHHFSSITQPAACPGTRVRAPGCQLGVFPLGFASLVVGYVWQCRYPRMCHLQRKYLCICWKDCFFLSEFGSLNTFLPDCQKVTYFVFAIFLCHTFHRETFVGLERFEQSCLMFID